MKSKALGVLAATAAAGLFATAPAVAGPKIVDGHYCSNNTCKGKSACGGFGNKNGCHGNNDCKGQGWLSQGNKEDCEKNGGKWATAPKKEDKKAKGKMKKHKKSGD
jgi:hypothetical protein